MSRCCGRDAASSPAATQRRLKAFRAEVSEGVEKKLDMTQRRLCVLVIGSARKGFSWKTAKGWLEGRGGAFGGFGGNVNYGFRENEVCEGWGPSLWQRHGPFSGSAALRPQREDFFIYLFNFMPCRPQNGPQCLSESALSSLTWLPAAVLSPETRPLMAALFLDVVVVSSTRRGREFEAGDLRTPIQKCSICVVSVGVGTEAN